MSRKINPWVVMVALILALILTACEYCATAEEINAPRFTVERASDNSNNSDHQGYIITDTATGVQYLFFHDYQAGGLAKLEPAPEKEAKE